MAAELTGAYLTLDDGRPAVRFSRTYHHPIGRVWQFVTDPEELAHWFPSRMEIEPRTGGVIRFGGDPDLEDSTGTVLAVDVPRHLSFDRGGDELRFDLEALDDRRTRFTLTNVLQSADTAARNGAGWEVCLAALDARARGEDFEGAHAGHTPARDRCYAAYIETGIPSGAPVPGVGA
ncbi:SRPBCC family protein [Streptomyces sp. TRM68367]|uniref:SRPBCC family protein n=1 Tax=Streptomyces sp. TRM68367 TaxID=2758415 RepID=UPI00165CD210|nr:SRPBCC family protein [Streptomyces sp. TRM68367]MBC9724836.1 SRPBCC family protein [Streptomyces sp. TRM68367]